MSKSLPHAKITPRRSASRGHAHHGWLNTYHTFSFADYHDPNFQSFGALRVLNEDRVSPRNGFPTHPHRDAEIFSYILSGELTHRDSMVRGGAGDDKDTFYRMKRGDVQFTTGGTGIAHSETNEHPSEDVHFLQIWATPWKRSLPPVYHTATFPDADKKNTFRTIISPLKAGVDATPVEEKEAVPAIEGTVPVHADLLMAAAIIDPGASAIYIVGGGGGAEGRGAVTSREDRKVYLHLPMMGKGAKAKVRVVGDGSNGGDDTVVLGEGDGAFVEGVGFGDRILVDSTGEGEGEAEVVLLDSS